MRDALETTHEITKLVKKSPKRDTKLGAIKKAFETEDDANGVMAETITLRKIVRQHYKQFRTFERAL